MSTRVTRLIPRGIVFRQSIRPTVRLSVRYNSTAKITSIVDDIAKLNLLETSQLIVELKERLNIPDISIPSAGAVPAAAPAAAPVEQAAEPVEEKTVFTIKLESFDAKSKPKIIKEVKNLLGLSLVESKKFVESAPKVLKENVPKEDADKIKETIEGLGAKIVLE